MQLKQQKEVLPEIQKTRKSEQDRSSSGAQSRGNSLTPPQPRRLSIAPDGYIPWSTVRAVVRPLPTRPGKEPRHLWPVQGSVKKVESEEDLVRYMSDDEDDPLHQQDSSDIELLNKRGEAGLDEECDQEESEESEGAAEERQQRPTIDWVNKKPKDIKHQRKMIPPKKPDVHNEEVLDRLHPLIKEIVSRPWFPQSVSRTVGGVVSAFIGLMDLVDYDIHTEICNYIIRFKNELGFPEDELSVFVNKLMAQLDHQESKKRVNAVKTLGQLGVATNVVVAAVIKHLIDEEPDVRKAAELCLSQLKDIQNKDQLVSYLESIGAYKRNRTKMTEIELGEILQKKAGLSLSKFGEETDYDPMSHVRQWIKGLQETEDKKKPKKKKKQKVAENLQVDKKSKRPGFKIKRRKLPNFIVKKKLAPNNAKTWKSFAKRKVMDFKKKIDDARKKKEEEAKKAEAEKTGEEQKEKEETGEKSKSVSPQKLAEKLKELDGKEDPNMIDDWATKNAEAAQEVEQGDKLRVRPVAIEDIPENWHNFFELPSVRARAQTEGQMDLKRRSDQRSQPQRRVVGPLKKFRNARANAEFTIKTIDNITNLPTLPETEAEYINEQTRRFLVYRPCQIIKQFKESNLTLQVVEDPWYGTERYVLNDYFNSDWVPPAPPEPWPIRNREIPKKYKTVAPPRLPPCEKHTKQIQENDDIAQQTLDNKTFTYHAPPTAHRETAIKENSKSDQLPPLPNVLPLALNTKAERKDSYLTLPEGYDEVKSRQRLPRCEPLTMLAFCRNKKKITPCRDGAFRWENTFEKSADGAVFSPKLLQVSPQVPQ